MGRFAPVAPVHILQEMLEANILGSYHLLLAHHTVEKADEFRRLWEAYGASRANAYVKTTIIMDNSIVELGGAVDSAMIKEAVDIVSSSALGGPTVVPVLPDVMGDGEKTKWFSWDALQMWDRPLKHGGMPGHGFMLVTQGKDFNDFAKLVNFFFIEQADRTKNVAWVGIPRKIQQTWDSHTRARAIQYIKTIAPQVKIHLLGFSDDIADDMFCASLNGVSGIDSAVPIRYNAILTPVTGDDEIGPRKDWWENGKLTHWSKTNLRRVRSWVGSND